MDEFLVLHSKAYNVLGRAKDLVILGQTSQYGRQGYQVIDKITPAKGGV